jgi:tetratricopeptide (TPR) repeat protein
MIQLDPNETANYFVLAKIYEDAGNIDQAEEQLMKAKEVKPKDSAVYQYLAGFYQRQGEFEKLIAAVQQRSALEPNNPEAHYTVATYYWDEGYRNTRLTEAQKREYVKNGLTAIDKAIALNPDYVEALTYRGLLLRLEAAMEKDAGRQKALLNEATALQEKAVGLKKKQAAGAN